MQKDACVLVDVSDLLELIDPDKQYPSEAIEMMFVRTYIHSYAVPCVSTSLLTGITSDRRSSSGPISESYTLARIAAEKGVDVLDYLPPDLLELSDQLGLYFMLWRYTLIIGSQRAVEKQWRSLCHRSW